jgi:hypothetical protein
MTISCDFTGTSIELGLQVDPGTDACEPRLELLINGAPTEVIPDFTEFRFREYPRVQPGDAGRLLVGRCGPFVRYVFESRERHTAARGAIEVAITMEDGHCELLGRLRSGPAACVNVYCPDGPIVDVTVCDRTFPGCMSRRVHGVGIGVLRAQQLIAEHCPGWVLDRRDRGMGFSFEPRLVRHGFRDEDPDPYRLRELARFPLYRLEEQKAAARGSMDDPRQARRGEARRRRHG